VAWVADFRERYADFRLPAPLTMVAGGQELNAGSPRERIVLAMLLERERLV
jgi:hypothetical protein